MPKMEEVTGGLGKFRGGQPHNLYFSANIVTWLECDYRRGLD
jgi:hypothetical protein